MKANVWGKSQDLPPLIPDYFIKQPQLASILNLQKRKVKAKKNDTMLKKLILGAIEV